MKRSWFGAGLLAALLILSLLSSRFMGRCHAPVSRDLEQAAQTALAGDWVQTDALTKRAADCWERCRHFSAAMTNHAPMEQIDSLFARLQVYERARNRQATAALCAEIAQQVEDIGEAQKGSWWNLL